MSVQSLQQIRERDCHSYTVLHVARCVAHIPVNTNNSGQHAIEGAAH